MNEPPKALPTLDDGWYLWYEAIMQYGPSRPRIVSLRYPGVDQFHKPVHRKKIMGPVARRSVLAFLVLSSIAASGYAQFDWPVQYGDAANTVSTPVLLGENLNILWEADATVGLAPLLHVNKAGETLLISGYNVYYAADGVFAGTVPDAGDIAAVTTVKGATRGDDLDVLLVGRARDSSLSTGYEFFAYDLNSQETNGDYVLLWYLDSLVDLSINRYMWLNAKNGVFYIAGTAPYDGIAAVYAEGNGDGTTTVKWEKVSLTVGLPILGDGLFFSLDGVAVGKGSEGDIVFASIEGGGFVAIDASILDPTSSVPPLWYVSHPDADSPLPCVDELNQIVYFTSRSSEHGYFVHAYTFDGVPAWNAPAQLDFILNGSPSLGWVNNGQEALFGVTGGFDGEAGVYAFDRATGERLWLASLPADAWSSPLYSGGVTGGKLYIGANDSHTYVLDASSGNLVQILATDFEQSYLQKCPAIVDVELEGVLYWVNSTGQVCAWSASGTGTIPQVPYLSISAAPDQISINSPTPTIVTATCKDGDSNPIVGKVVTFSCDASKNQGYIETTSGQTDSNGKATTKFWSQNRAGTVTVTATVPGADPVGTTISVVKSGGEEPPPTEAGTIQGTVRINGKAARKLTVTLTGPVNATTTTNPKGKYTFEGLSSGVYVVYATKNGLEDSVEVNMPEPPVTRSGVDLYLE